MTDTDKPQTPNTSQTHTDHVPGHWDRWQKFRASKKQQFQMKFRFQQRISDFGKQLASPHSPNLNTFIFTRLESSKSLYQTLHREFRLINKPKKKHEATFYETARVWIILDCMKVEEMPNLQVQPVRAALVLLNSACPHWEFAGNFQEAAPGIHPQSHMDKKPQ